MKRNLFLWAVMLLIFGSGCGSSEPVTFSEVADSAAGDAVKRDLADGEPTGASAGFAAVLTERLIIRNASLDLIVDDTEASVGQISQLVSELGGVVVSSQMTTFDEGVRASVTARVPAESFDYALQQMRAWQGGAPPDHLRRGCNRGVRRSAGAIAPPGGDRSAASQLFG